VAKARKVARITALSGFRGFLGPFLAGANVGKLLQWRAWKNNLLLAK
jgi:hypothetical protein